MLNPSTADAEDNDQTLDKCLRYAKSWGYGCLLVGNLFAWKATNPKDLKAAGKCDEDLVGPHNDAALRDMASSADLMVAAWGKDGSMKGRSATVQRMFAGRLHYLRFTKKCEPGHPLYLPGDLEPTWLPFKHILQSAEDL